MWRGEAAAGKTRGADMPAPSSQSVRAALCSSGRHARASPRARPASASPALRCRHARARRVHSLYVYGTRACPPRTPLVSGGRSFAPRGRHAHHGRGAGQQGPAARARERGGCTRKECARPGERSPREPLAVGSARSTLVSPYRVSHTKHSLAIASDETWSPKQRLTL